MRTALVLMGGLLCLIGCSSETHTPSDRAPADALSTIKYRVDGTFEIAGTDIKGITLDNLSQELTRHQEQHAGATYELYAENKCHPELSDKIIATIRESGVTLKHYWAPYNDADPQGSPGKYGVGQVDILEQQGSG